MIAIDVSAAIRQPGKIFEFEYNGKPNFENIDFLKPITLKCKYSAIDNGKAIKLKGSYNTLIQEVCVRCLDDVPLELNRDFEEIFSEDETEGQQYSLKSNEILLDKMLYDDIMLNIPLHLLCKEDCNGLCTNCGVNLNRDKCVCSPETNIDENNPFAKLKDLF